MPETDLQGIREYNRSFWQVFKDTVGLLVNTVTSVTYDGNALTKTTDYTLAAGKLTIKKGVIQAAGSHTIVVKSSAYEDATVTQLIKAGAPDAITNSTKTTAEKYTVGTVLISAAAISCIDYCRNHDRSANAQEMMDSLCCRNKTTIMKVSEKIR